MESVRKLEKSLVDWYKQWPHLPTNVASFLGEWAWLFALISVILSVLGVVAVVSITFFGAILLAGMGTTYAAAGGIVLVAVIISLAFSILIIYLTAMAIMPLKERRKKGWNFIYYVVLLNLAAGVVSAVLSANLFSLIWTALWTLIGGYFLFEVRGYFISHAHTKVAKK